MITLKSPHEIELMRRAGKITAAARALAGEMVKPGVTTQEIDRAVEHFIRKQGAVPSFLHYNGYPASACISVNDEVIHGIPGKRVLQEGVCDTCGGKLVQRKDDAPETVKARLEVYHKETEPLKGFYAQRGLLKSVENQPTVADTTQAILRALGR